MKHLGQFLIAIVAVAAIGFFVADGLYFASFQAKFKDLEKQRIVTSNRLTTAKIVYENLNHVSDLVFQNIDFPGQKDSVTPEKVYFDFLTTCINDLKMKILSVKATQPVTMGHITIYGYDIELEGDFFKFGELCSKFENSRRLISIESFKIDRIEGGEKEVQSSGNKGVRVSMRVYTYRVRKGLES